MKIFDSILDNDDKKKDKDEGRLTLHKEELDINKSVVQKGEVELIKEIVEEQKNSGCSSYS
nr:DUF2382 domain-containing protein [Clostridium muellerianum]